MTDATQSTPSGPAPDRADPLETAIAAMLPVAVVLMGAFFTWHVPVFLTVGNLLSITVQVAALMTISIPFAMLLMAGKLDLSVGSTLAICGVVAGLSFGPLGTAGAVVLALLTGTVIGTLNGIMVSWMGLSPIIATLGTLTFLRGAAQWLAPTPVFGFPPDFLTLGYGRWLSVPYLTWLMVLVVILGLLAMKFLPFGRHVIAIGVNARAAYLVGVRVQRTGILLYALVGFATATAALMSISRINSAPAGTLGVGMELSVLTAVLLGGIPFTGGKGSILRVALGVVLLGMLSNGLVLMNAQAEVSLMITGLVLIFAAGLNVLRALR